MQLAQILQNSYGTPLTTAQVTGLFQAGCLRRHTGSDLSQEADGQLIDDLLPLLNYRDSRETIRHLPAARRPARPFRLSLPTAIPLVFVGAAASVVMGCLFFTARPSIASPVRTRIASPAAASSVPVKKETRKRVPLLPEESRDAFASR